MVGRRTKECWGAGGLGGAVIGRGLGADQQQQYEDL